MNDKAPILSLRMKYSQQAQTEAMLDRSDAMDSVKAMVSQEASYKCRDYLGRRRKRGEIDAFDKDCPMINQEEMVDEVCREKMCEWSYRVCDHFHTSREIVAFAFSFLDRFIDRCSCDRTAFKLAAMTSLYMATKMLNAKQISIGSLAELSRGEFEVAHIAEMERIILETLEWRMNPPTVRSFIGLLGHLLPSGDASVVNGICERALFFSELCVYDYNFVTEDKYFTAITCLLNAIEGLENSHRAVEMKRDLLLALGSHIGVPFEIIAIEKAQARIWYLYSCSAQLQCDDVQPTQSAQERLVKYNFMTEPNAGSHSPVSVEINGQF